jgi:hypothetical protein
MVKFTHIPVTSRCIAKIPLTSLNNVLLSKNLIQDNSIKFSNILTSYNYNYTLTNEISELLNPKKPIKHFFNINLNLRLHKLVQNI